MSESGCTNNECTVRETGVCILNNEPEDCPHRVPDDYVDPSDDHGVDPDEAALPAPEEVPRFAPSGALGVDEVRALMRNEYCHVIGLLGEPDSGKTACLASLYLLLARNMLDGFRYADSRSLVALDEVSRGARSWDGGMPEQVTAHTVQTDDRSAGFLHVKLVRDLDSARLHLLIPDLPGEWSTSLIDNNRTDRWQFLRSAEVIWLMVDGTSLAEAKQRLNLIHRTSRLIDRLVALLSPDMPALRIVVTRYDLAKPSEEILEQLREHGTRHNLEVEIDHVASFSEDDQTVAGTGIAGLVRGTVAVTSCRDDFWPDMVCGSDRDGMTTAS